MKDFYSTNVEKGEIISFNFAVGLLLVLGAIFVPLFFYSFYSTDGFNNVHKITYTCNQPEKQFQCVVIGQVAERPFLKEIKVKPTPKFPILNCPVYITDCDQTPIFINKDDIINHQRL